MTVDYKVIELLCIIDEFCKHFDAENAGNLLEDRVKIGVSDLGRVGFAMHYWLHLSNSSMLDCIRFERAESPMSA